MKGYEKVIIEESIYIKHFNSTVVYPKINHLRVESIYLYKFNFFVVKQYIKYRYFCKLQFKIMGDK